MTFLHPEFLYYLLPPLFILFGFLLTQKSAQESYFSDEVMAKLRVSANRLTLKARNGLFLLIAVLMIFALSGPVIDEGKIEVKAKSADIMIALDISDSMLAEDVYPSRLKLAKQKALDLLKLVPNERVGVIAFAKNSYLVSPLSFDADAVGFLLRALNTDSITEKGTNFLSMLSVVAKSVKSHEKKYLLILSDGGDSKDFSQEIAFAKEKNIVIFVLGVGTTKGAPIKKEDGSFVKHNGVIIISKRNDSISALATDSGGVYIRSVNSREDIKAMLGEIKVHSKQKELKSQEIKRYIPLFYYPLGLALLLLLIATSSMSKRQKLNIPAIFLLGMMFTNNTNLEAGVVDFMELQEAREAYESGDYKRAENLYKKYVSSSNKAETYYNIGNALYKQERYKEAVKSYEKATFSTDVARAKNYANLGNSYVKSKVKDGLQKAISAYENSLKLKEDKDTRENLEAVKKAMEKKKEQKKKKQDKDSKDDDKQNKNSKEKEKDKKSDNKQEKKSQELKDKSTKKKEQKTEDLKDNMSDAEEKKWLKELNKSQSTFLYRLNKENKYEENRDEKPW